MPVLRESEHYFLDLPKCRDFLKEWIHSGTIAPDVANKLEEWVEGGLRAWDVSRDAPYFGFEIPGTTEKYFYVWLDAPIGYMAAFKYFCKQQGIDPEEFWRADSPCEVHHFVGKDIINFHCLFWPATLHYSQFRTPTRVHVHGFINDGGEKMSKSRGRLILLREYLQFLDPDYIRYYYAARLTANVRDIEFNLDDFIARVNSDLVNKLVNIASRCAGFIHRNFDSKLATGFESEQIWQDAVNLGDELADDYERDEYSRAVRTITDHADACNRYVNEHEPWKLIKEGKNLETAHRVCSTAIDVFRILMLYLKPVVPALAERAEEFLQRENPDWSSIGKSLAGERIGKFKSLLPRLDPKTVAKMLEAVSGESETATTAMEVKATTDYISIDDFAKVELKVAIIKEAGFVDGADKLLQLKLDVGDHERTVFSGIRSAYNPDELVGKATVVVANLAPRKMKFGISEGMVLAAGPGDKGIFLLSPDEGATAGMKVS